MFETIEAAPADAILGLTEAFKSDPNPNKINLSVGVYKDANGQTPVLASVKEAEKRILETESSKGYLGIAGSPEYAALVQNMLFGQDSEVVAAGRARTTQTPGGTGALRVAGDFVHKTLPGATVWLSQPTWPNHPSIFAATGVPLATYPYFDAAGNCLDEAAVMSALSQVPAGDVVLLHGCCHNPSGVDPTADQWQKIAETLASRGIVPLLDFAYQGFGSGLSEDRVGLDALLAACKELIICNSFSKNFGLYNERIGGLTIVAQNNDAADTVLSQIKACVRSNYSNPPAHGAAIVSTILSDAELTSQWEGELAAMRDRINTMRSLFVETLVAKGASRDFSFIRDQRGMFSFSGLNREQVDRLRSEHSIYIV
ncbi:MAG: aspartate/tyrosine/aromatic aminotransferase, partial [Pirellulales bacterium]|nr:aspartate/tyrosine/aromatic aminotransferase [Pirellulales bacterium]